MKYPRRSARSATSIPYHFQPRTKPNDASSLPHLHCRISARLVRSHSPLDDPESRFQMINTFKRFEVRPALKSKGGSLRDFKGKLKFVEAVDYQIACGKSYSVAWYVFAIDVSDMSWRLTKADSEHGARAIANMLTASLTPTPAPIVHGFDEGTTITALCIWEEMLLRQGRADSAETLKKRWDDEGAYAMRQLAISMTPALETLFRSVPQWEGVVTFDWEWIPAALDCYDWDKETFQPDARAKLLERFPVAGLKIVTRR